MIMSDRQLRRIFFFLLLLYNNCDSEYIQNFEIKEGSPVGSVVGIVGSGSGNSRLPSPPYLIVPLSGSVNPERDLLINQQTGEIRTKIILDREMTSSYSLSAIPRNGANIIVRIQILDVNDNSPIFVQREISMNIPENIPIGTKRQLIPAKDKDLELFSTQRYELISGNDKGSFRLHYDRDLDGILNIDLVVNKDLDRETTDFYKLEIRAYDGGNPPKTGSLTVNVKVQDLNDNPPLFDKQRYFTTISEDLPLGSSVLRVAARDADADRNAKIRYSINRRQSDKERIFKIDENTGLIMLDRTLNFDRKQVHEIVVVAKDGGEVPQETSAFVTVRLTADNEFLKEINEKNSSERIKIIPNPPSVLESSPVGLAIARMEVGERHDSNLFEFEISPKNGVFGLRKNSSGTFLINTRKLDYEKKHVYSINVRAIDPTNSEKVFDGSFQIIVRDENDYPPEFEVGEYFANLEESVEPGSSVLTVKAYDKDHGENGRISYSLKYEGSKYSDWFMISESTGLITTQTFLDCEMENAPSVVIVATDHGYPSALSATATLSVSVSDINDNQPLFESSYYEADLSEDHALGECFLRVHATDSDCGANSQISYTLKDDNEDDARESFTIERDTGRICLSKELDYETRDVYDFSVVAKDRGGLSTSTMVKVQISDVNDNAPIFFPTEYFTKIDRNFSVSEAIILEVRAKDADSGDSAKITYEIIAGNVENTFSLNSKTGALTLFKKIPSNLNRFRLEVDAVDGYGLKASDRGGGKASLEILVSDDSEDLKVRKTVYEFSVPEDISPYSQIGVVAPLERNDIGSYDMTVYGTSEAFNYFSLDSKTGVLRSESRLNYEKSPEIVLNVKIEKSGRYTFCQVVIHIIDVNDNTPEFGSEIALASVSEDFAVGGIVYVARARDADTGINGKIIYSLLAEKEPSYFSLDSSSGALKLFRPLDYETKDLHEIIIEARDSGNPPLKTRLKLELSVHDVNDNSPEFYDIHKEIHISENYPIDTKVYTFKARDADRGRNGRISYQVSPNEYINVLPNSGVLILKKPLDREADQEFEVIVTAKDHGTPSLSTDKRVRIIVSDRNDNSPKFEVDLYEFSVLENLPPDAVIGTVNAYDQDDGPNGDILYHFKTPIEKFKINKVTGIISTSQSLDREEKNSYEILIEATDGGSPSRSSQTVVQINVTDVNDNSPELIEPQNRMLYVKEGSMSGTLLGKLFARDLDEDNKITYLPEDSSLVQITPDGEVRLLRAIEYSEKELKIPLTINDNGSPSKFTKVELKLIVIGRNDDRPYNPSTLSQKMSVIEGTKVGTKIGSISSIGRKGVHFNLLNPTSPPTFMVNKKTGDVITTGILDADIEPQYNLRIRLDEGEEDSGEASTVTVEITVKNENDERPVFETDPLELQIAESTQIGSRITKIEAIDGDINDVISYELIEQSPSVNFAVNNLSGELTLIKELDYETDKEFLVIVRATDVGSVHTAELTIWVTVTDTNDNSPIFLSSSELQIFSDVPLNVNIMNILAVDHDSGKFGEINYSILNGNAAGIYRIEEKNGQLTLVKSPESTTYRLTIRARDGGGLFTDQTLTISVKINNDSTPRFLRSVSEVVVSEDTEPDTTILSLELKQRTSTSNNVLFSMLKGSNSFYVDEYSGRIKTLVRLDRETQNMYALVVQVTSEDVAVFSDTTVVNVKISDINDNPPVFGQSCRDLSVPENFNASSKNYVQAIVAYDEDEGENGRVNYSLSYDYKGKFWIDSISGRLYFQPLDREEKEEYSLEIVASDFGAPPRSSICKIQLRVLDVNDNVPIFSKPVYTSNVQENAPIGTEILRVSARDNDKDKNAQVRYSLLTTKGLAHNFAIDSVSGSIFTTELLDRDSLVSDEPFFSFEVMAIDGGMENILSSSAKVKVTILDTNDNAPEFTDFPFRANISSSPLIGSSLLRLFASDLDSEHNGELVFSLRDKDKKFIDVTPNEGIVSVAADSGWESNTIRTFEVMVTDKGLPPKSSKGLIELRVDGGPAISLSFQKPFYSVELNENPSSGQDVAQVRAVRSDGRRQRVIYTFLRGNKDGAFQINSNNGLIRIRDPEKIDFEINKEFNLTLSGQGVGEDGLNAYAIIHIKVKNVNDNAPKFSQEFYIAKVWEGYDKGTKVLQLLAQDLDDVNENIMYEIIDGNVDGAFTISPKTSGIIQTNTVMDREIREEYELTVSATDSGSPGLMGITRVRISIIDTNDNQPHFPPMRHIKVSKEIFPGSLVANLRANDIDMSPRLTYKLESNKDIFAINTFTGQLYLLSYPSFEENGNEYNITVIASDTKHVARANTIVNFATDGKFCRKMSQFQKPVYQFTVPTNVTYPYPAGKIQLVSASECNGRLFKLDEDSDHNTFSVSSNGNILVHHGNWKLSNLIVRAISDSKSKVIATAVVILNQNFAGNEEASSSLLLIDVPNELDINSVILYKPIYRVKVNKPTQGLYFNINSSEGDYKIDSTNGDIYYVGKKEPMNEKLTVSVRLAGDASSSAEAFINIKPSSEISAEKENSFTNNFTSVSILEDAEVGKTMIPLCNFSKFTVSGPPYVRVISGNENNVFTLDEEAVNLVLNKNLDYETSKKHVIVVRMGSSKLSICKVQVNVLNTNDNVPKFPIQHFIGSVYENSVAGSPVMTPPVIDEDENDTLTFWTDSAEFEVSKETGEISTTRVFDYEIKKSYHLNYYVNDSLGHQAECSIDIFIESVDEYPPIFERNNYFFSMPGLANPGDVVGQIRAEDRDSGPDGKIYYSFTTLSDYFGIDESRGVITVIKSLDTGVFGGNHREKRSPKELKLIVQAKSRRPKSLNSSTIISISIEESLLPVAVISAEGTVPAWVQGVLVGIILLLIVLGIGLFIHFRRKKKANEQIHKFGSSSINTLNNNSGNRTASTSADNIDMELSHASGSGGVLSRFPPQYSEIVLDYERSSSSGKPATSATNPARSEISEKSHRSASSGRGSVEEGDEEDVEIRMINEGSYLSPDGSFLMDDDKLSQSSVQNSKDYFARLGIDIRKPPNLNLPPSTGGGIPTSCNPGLSGDNIHNFDTNSIYNRIPEDAMSEKNSVVSANTKQSLIYGSHPRTGQPSLTGSLSSIVHSEEELAGSYNWDYLLDWGPQYQPLAHVFKEISRLKDSSSAPIGGGNVSRGSEGVDFRKPEPKTFNPLQNAGLRLSRSARSPISHDALSQSALSPSFHPALSPLATKSPSVSPLALPMSRRPPATDKTKRRENITSVI